VQNGQTLDFMPHGARVNIYLDVRTRVRFRIPPPNEHATLAVAFLFYDVPRNRSCVRYGRGAKAGFREEVLRAAGAAARTRPAREIPAASTK